MIKYSPLLIIILLFINSNLPAHEFLDSPHADSLSVAEADSIDFKVEPLPILSYDSNTGFGFGAKSFFLNLLNMRESIDLIVFMSTKGEKWFQFVFSIPDFDLRQGKYYPLAADFLFDYDKWIVYNYFGIGNSSNFADKEEYVRELTAIKLDISRGFTPFFIGKIGLKYNRIESWDFTAGSQLEKRLPYQNTPLLAYMSVYLNLRYDQRDSYLHPTRGIVLQTDIEWAPEDTEKSREFVKWSFWFQIYRQVLFPKTVLAWRLGLASINGNQIPIQLLLPLGGNRSLRGYSLSRFIDHTAGLTNLELRFPIYGRLGGLLGIDAGRVWSSSKKISLDGWHTNMVTGLRYFLDTYIVRVDFGLSRETLGIYFNFNHIF